MIITNPEKLWIAANFQSTEATRYYLNGVFIEPCDLGGLTITATDGHRLVSVYDPEGTCSKAMIAIITKDTMRALKKADSVTIDDDNLLTVYKNRDRGEAIHIHPGSCEIDGTFPDWRRIVPTETSGEQSPGFNTKYLGQFKALAGFSHLDIITIFDNGKGPAMVSNGNPEIVAVQMPATNAGATAEVPEWISVKQANAA